MRVLVVTPPEPVVSLEEAKLHLRVDDDGEDTLISGLIAAATRGLDGPDGWLGRALGRQGLRLYAGWAEGRLWDGSRMAFELPYPPTRSQDAMAISAVSYTDSSGVQVSLSEDAWSLSPCGSAVLASSLAACTVQIDYTTGTPVPEGEETAPIAEEVRCAILLTVGSLYANREAEVIDSRAVVAPNPAAERLLAPQRIWRL